MTSRLRYVPISDLPQPQQGLAFQEVLRKGCLQVEQVKEIYEINSVMLDKKREYVEEVDRNGKILEKMKMKRPALCDVKGINAVLEACEG